MKKQFSVLLFWCVLMAFPGLVFGDRFAPSSGSKVGPLLTRVLRARNTGRRTAGPAANNPVKIIVSLGDDYLAQLPDDLLQELAGKVAALGGRLGRHAYNNVQAWLPDDKIGELEQWSAVSFISLPVVPVLCGPESDGTLERLPSTDVRARENVVSEGLAAIGADKWQQIGITGQDVNVAILDLGFKGFSQLLGSELPADVNAYYFGDPEGALAFVHGTACAEIVHDVAPEASITLLYAGDMDVDFSRAVAWMLNHDIDVCSSSIGMNLKVICTYMYYALHGDGSDPDLAAYYLEQLVRKTRQIDATVASAVAGGLTWVQSAGNDGRKKWSGRFRDIDNDGLLNFSATEDFNIVDTTRCGGQSVYVMLMWDEVAGSLADYDLMVYDDDLNLVSISALSQDRIKAGVEACAFQPQPGVTYRLAVFKDHGVSQNLDLYVGHDDFPMLKYYNNAGTVMLAHPAPVSEAITVGAMEREAGKWDIAFYSSQGPGEDGVLKPEVMAPAGVSTASYGPGRFHGTSAAAPHVTGLCALHKQFYPHDTPALQKAFLQNTAIDYGVPGPDNTYGSGLAHLPVGVFNQPTLYFTGLSENSGDRNRIGIVNPFRPLRLFGRLKACDDSGQELASRELFLPSGGRQEFLLADVFPKLTGLSYLKLDYRGGRACGYVSGESAAANCGYMVPAVDRASGGDMFIPHIASDNIWKTRVELVNTGDSDSHINVWFDNGIFRSFTLPPGHRKNFLIRDFFGGMPQSDIHSAKILGAQGLVGAEVFAGGNYAGGISLEPNIQKDIFFPHVANDDLWWTGLVAYNPSLTPVNLRIFPFDAHGNPLSGKTVSLPGEAQYIGTINTLGLPAATAWFKMEATGEVHSFELFGTSDWKQMAGYSTTGIRMSEGVFSRINHPGTWTGIAFVNPNRESVTMVLAAYDDAGVIKAFNHFSLQSYGKIVDTAENLFAYNNDNYDPVRMTEATHMVFIAAAEIIGFQLEGTTDSMILRSLPAQSIQ